jgi:hypothetical protein
MCEPLLEHGAVRDVRSPRLTRLGWSLAYGCNERPRSGSEHESITLPDLAILRMITSVIGWPSVQAIDLVHIPAAFEPTHSPRVTAATEPPSDLPPERREAIEGPPSLTRA